MAQTIAQIYDQMVTEKQTMTELTSLQPGIDSSQTLLSDLTTNSKVAVWRLLFFVVAVAHWTQQKLFDAHRAWIEQRASEIVVGSLPWIQRVALQFQYGDALVFINNRYQYATVNTAAQIVKLAVASEVGGEVILKVAKLDSSGDPIPLLPAELSAFGIYMNRMKFAGTIINTVSRDADLLKLSYIIYYDPLVLSSTGELISSPGTYPAEEAVHNYCKGLPFDGIYSITEQTDQIQQAVGVVDPVFQSAEAQFGANPYTAFAIKYNPNAGYLKVDPAHPLTTTFTYIAVL